MNQAVMDIMREIGTNECIADTETEVIVPEGPDQDGDGHYVTVRSGQDVGLVLGPYPSQIKALANLGRARTFLRDNVPGSQEYVFGAVRVRGYGRKLGEGKLNGTIGL